MFEKFRSPCENNPLHKTKIVLAWDEPGEGFYKSDEGDHCTF